MSVPVVVTAAIIQKDGLVLVAQRKHSSWLEPDKWEFPGGKLEAGESAEECVVREIREELGLDIEVERLFMVHPFTYVKEGVERPIVLHVFLARWAGGEARCLDCQAFRWIPVEGLMGFSFVAGDRKIVEAFLDFASKK
jgi:8-oxo-dGTP diphosphatase